MVLLDQRFNLIAQTRARFSVTGCVVVLESREGNSNLIALPAIERYELSVYKNIRIHHAILIHWRHDYFVSQILGLMPQLHVTYYFSLNGTIHQLALRMSIRKVDALGIVLGDYIDGNLVLQKGVNQSIGLIVRLFEAEAVG